MINSKRLILLTCLTATLSTTALAESEIEWSGYLNVIAQINDSEIPYLGEIDDHGDFDETSFGLAIAKKLNSKMRVAAQMHMTEASVELDWAFLQYNMSDEMTAKVGRIKYPSSLFSEIIDIGAIQPWVTAPESVYSESVEFLIEAYNGAALNYTTGDDVEFSTEVFVGEQNAEDEGHEQLFGVVLKASNDNITAFVSASRATIDTGDAVEIISDRRVRWLGVGIQVDYDIVDIYAELFSAEISGLPERDRQGWYVTFAKPINTWTPTLTFQSFKTVDGGPEQTSFTLGINKQINTQMVAKFEIQTIDAENGGLFESQPDGNVTQANVSLNLTF